MLECFDLEVRNCSATYNNDVVRQYAYALTGWTYPVGGFLPGVFLLWCAAILALAATIAGSTQLSWRGRTADPLLTVGTLLVYWVAEQYARTLAHALRDPVTKQM